jgi:hypothetical protein
MKHVMLISPHIERSPKAVDVSTASTLLNTRMRQFRVGIHGVRIPSRRGTRHNEESWLEEWCQHGRLFAFLRTRL